MASPIKYYTKWTRRPEPHVEELTFDIITLQGASSTPRQLIERHALDPLQTLNRSPVTYDVEAVFDNSGRIVPEKDVDLDRSFFPDPSWDYFDYRSHALDVNEMYQYEQQDLHAQQASADSGESKSDSMADSEAASGD